MEGASEDPGGGHPTPEGAARGRFAEPQRRSRWGLQRRTLLVGGFALFVVLAVIALSPDKTDTTAGPTTTEEPGSSGDPAPVRCVSGGWPVAFEDEPGALDEPDGVASYIWRDAEGWHVRVRDPGTATSFKVVLTSADGLLPDQFRLSGTDHGNLEVKGRNATFDTPGSPRLKGFDFSACFISEMRVQVLANGVPIPPEDISIGVGNAATENPVTIQRRP